jgi:hypothetical protein
MSLAIQPDSFLLLRLRDRARRRIWRRPLLLRPVPERNLPTSQSSAQQIPHDRGRCKHVMHRDLGRYLFALFRSSVALGVCCFIATILYDGSSLEDINANVVIIADRNLCLGQSCPLRLENGFPAEVCSESSQRMILGLKYCYMIVPSYPKTLPVFIWRRGQSREEPAWMTSESKGQPDNVGERTAALTSRI